MDKQTFQRLHDYMTRVLGADGSGHGTDHIDRVVANTRQLLADTPEADADLAIAAALLHDTYDAKLVSDVAAARAATRAELIAAGYTDGSADAVLAIIDQLSYSYQLDHPEVSLTLTGQLVQDADRLDAIGAIGIARAFAYGGAKNRALYSSDGPRTDLDGTTYHAGGDTINHFYEKLLLLADQMHTPAARRVATARTAVMRQFLAEFAAEVAGER